MTAKQIINRIWDQYFSHATIDLYCWFLQKKALIIHASSVVVGGNCFVFLGNSGIGKTTIAKFFYSRYGANSILNDDLIVIQKKGKQLLLYGTPWIGQKTKQEKDLARALSSRQVISNKEKKIYFFYLRQSKKNLVYDRLSDLYKMRVFVQALLGNHIFLRHEAVDLASTDILDGGLSEKSKKAYRRSIHLVQEIVDAISIRTLYFKNSVSLVDYLVLWASRFDKQL